MIVFFTISDDHINPYTAVQSIPMTPPQQQDRRVLQSLSDNCPQPDFSDSADSDKFFLDRHDDRVTSDNDNNSVKEYTVTNHKLKNKTSTDERYGLCPTIRLFDFYSECSGRPVDINKNVLRGIFHLWYFIKTIQGFFSQIGEAAQPLILGKNCMGEVKLDVISIFGENCIILKKFSLGKQPYIPPQL
jgi:hypothetical protein